MDKERGSADDAVKPPAPVGEGSRARPSTVLRYEADPGAVMWRRAIAKGELFGNDPNHHLQPYTIPIPNARLREASSVASLDMFFAIGEAWAHMVSHFLPPQPRVLDLGCGCGRLARFLLLNPGVRYVGVDLFRPAIDWCREAFRPLGDNFQFEYFDGYSSVYNPTGSIKPADYIFPCADQSIDLTVCASLFTHLLLPDCQHYLSEIARVTKAGGQAIISLHTPAAEGTRFSGDESRIAVDPLFFAEVAAGAGLHLRCEIGSIYSQEAYLFQR